MKGCQSLEYPAAAEGWIRTKKKEKPEEERDRFSFPRLMLFLYNIFSRVFSGARARVIPCWEKFSCSAEPAASQSAAAAARASLIILRVLV